jgi:hypothetical protein
LLQNVFILNIQRQVPTCRISRFKKQKFYILSAKKHLCVRSQASAEIEISYSVSELLHGVRWFKIDVSELPIGPIFKVQAVSLDRLIFEDGTDRKSQNVGFKPQHAA